MSHPDSKAIVLLATLRAKLDKGEAAFEHAELTEGTFAAQEEALLEALSDAMDRGDLAPLTAYQAAYKEERGGEGEMIAPRGEVAASPLAGPSSFGGAQTPIEDPAPLAGLERVDGHPQRAPAPAVKDFDRTGFSDFRAISEGLKNGSLPFAREAHLLVGRPGPPPGPPPPSAPLTARDPNAPASDATGIVDFRAVSEALRSGALPFPMSSNPAAAAPGTPAPSAHIPNAPIPSRVGFVTTLPPDAPLPPDREGSAAPFNPDRTAIADFEALQAAVHRAKQGAEAQKSPTFNPDATAIADFRAISEALRNGVLPFTESVQPAAPPTPLPAEPHRDTGTVVGPAPALPPDLLKHKP